MKEVRQVRFNKYLMIIGATILILTVSGCDWFNGGNQSRPAPVRPRMENPMRSPAPTKRVPGISSVTEKSLLQRIGRTETEVRRGNWPGANREVDRLGLEMARFRPTKSRGKSLREIASFDTIYTRLQGDCKIRNRSSALRNLDRLRDTLRRR
jgi:hypothetical protein